MTEYVAYFWHNKMPEILIIHFTIWKV